MSKKTKKQGKPNYSKRQRQQAQQANTGTSKATPSQGAARPASAPVAAPRALTEAAPTPSPVVMLEPLAPIIIRSGRPFDAQAGPDAPRFPPPSTLAGCLRTAWARQRAQQSASDVTFDAHLLEQALAGPLLVRVDAAGQPQPLVPKPADAQYFGQGEQARCLRAEPQAFEAGCDADLPAGLSPVRLIEEIEEKGSGGPRWWAWEDIIAWRTDSKPAIEMAPLAKRGWSPPAGDLRTHVAIDAATQAADAGRLFQTEGLDLQPDNPWLKEKTAPEDLRLLARFSEPLGAGLVHLGGERRLARLQPLPQSQNGDGWPAIPEGWLRQIQDHQGLTLTLLTPGLFSAGYRPGWLDDQLQGEPPIAPGVRLQLVAAALERWQPHSGWDLAKQEARATRKLVGAGATYWFKLLEAADESALAPLWLASLCDGEQDRRDGYGLALPAPWTPTV